MTRDLSLLFQNLMQLPESSLNKVQINWLWWEKTAELIHAMALEIAELHQPKLKKPITYHYNNDHHLDMLPFRVLDDGKEDWIAKMLIYDMIFFMMMK